MSPKITGAIDQSKAFLSTLKPKQKAVLGGSVLATLGLFAALIHLVGNGDLRILYAGLQPAEAQEIVRHLGAKEIPYELSKDGTSISIPAGRLDEVRMQLASEGLPRSGRQGYEMFDKPNWMGSDFAEKVNYQRALEGELERTIQTLDEVEGVRVHLVMPHDSLFTDQERNAKAAVLLKLRSGRISDDKIDAITNLVSSAVDNLQPQDVTVVDADGQVPLLSSRGRRGVPKDVLGLESSLNDKLVATLAPVVGTGKVKAAISVDYEVGTSETTQELYDPNTVAIVNSQTSVERQSGDDQQDQGVPGTPSNVPGSTGQPAANKADSQTASTDDDIQKTENKTYAVSKTMRHLTEPSGTIRKISAAVLVDDAVEVSTVNGRKVETQRKRSSEEMKQILDVATMAIGIDAARGDRITVQNLSFVAFPDETEFHPTWNTRVVRVVQDWSTLLKYLGIIAVCFVFYLTFLKPLRNRVVASFAESKPALAGGRVHDALPDIAQGRDRGDRSAFGNPLADISHELSEGTSDVKRAVVLKRHLVDKIKTEPVAASRLIEDWVRQSEA
jgi:flagellar M-ring protein FliF